MGFTDESWNNNTSDEKGFTGYVLIFVGGDMNQTSKNQEMVALSTRKSELRSQNELKS